MNYITLVCSTMLLVAIEVVNFPNLYTALKVPIYFRTTLSAAFREQCEVTIHLCNF